MKIVRWLVGRLILLLDSVFSPRAVTRSGEEQAQLDQRTKAFALYQFEACPFCVKVRRHLKAMNVKVELRDATREPYRSELVREGGKLQAPCLKIEEGGASRWLYESSDIISFLDQSLGLKAN